MFTRKQLFRRCVTFKQVKQINTNNKQSTSTETLIKYNQYINEQQIQVVDNNIYSKSIYQVITDNTLITETIETTIKPLTKQKNLNKKKISFNTSVKVILIPTREEYIEANISELIWYNHSDYYSYKISARDEILQYIESNPDTTYRTAMKLLYQ
mmetsp:Transcript_24362/g.22138  ORF Transcript_24362/g.22138 Transcript_24362/m.22138 type:complete len:155 (+) Transcript_24362:25-489(+)